MKRAVYVWLILGIIFLWRTEPLMAQAPPVQKQLITQQHSWYRYQNRLILSDRWEWQSHIDDRRFFDHGHRQHAWVFRTQPFYNISEKVAVSQSYVYFIHSPHDPESASTLMVPEHRPFQEILIKNDLGKFPIRHRYRLEQRFVRKNDGIQLLEGYHFNWRIRYQFQIQRKLVEYSPGKILHIRLADEIMANFGRNIVYNTFDQNRFSAALVTNLSKNLDLEAGYSHWFQQRPDGTSFFNRHIYRITISQQIDLRAKKEGKH